MAKIHTSDVASRKLHSAGALSVLASAALAMLMAARPAIGADMSSRPLPAFMPLPFTWTGLYIGANLGGGWAHTTLNDSFTGISLGNSSSGVVGGGQLGYNYQFGGLVLGAEWTFDGISLNASGAVGALQGAAKTSWITTIAGRFGVAADNVLYYGKAGGGWANNSATLTNLNNGTQVGASNTNGGWLLGAGVEYAFAPHWSARLEYDYLGLNTWNVNSTLFAPNADRFSISRNVQAFTAGVDFKF
jgi:outer membrane immunogenic protein